MLDQNTDRMWYVIGAVLVGAAIILIANGTLPQMFASVTESFEDVIDMVNYDPEREKIDGLIAEGYIPVATANELNSIRNTSTRIYGKGTDWEKEYMGGLDKKYIQVADVDLSEYSEEGWKPIGISTSRFSGTYDGGNYDIRGLVVKGARNEYRGLFGYAKEATISNVRLIDNKVTGERYVGGLVGEADATTIENSYSTGSVTGTTNGSGYVAGGLVGYAKNNTTISNSYTTGPVVGEQTVGGLVGYANDSTIENSYATGAVEGTGTGTYSGRHVGGLVGQAGSNVTISNSYATGLVDSNGTLGRNVGGLVGDFGGFNPSTISNSYATGEVIGTDRVGGLVGSAHNGTIDKSYATGSATGTERYVGGLAGDANQNTTISNSYAIGSATGERYVGGLVGDIMNNTTIYNSYATGLVTVTDTAHVAFVLPGGLVGRAASSTISNSYWNKETTGQTNSAVKGEGKSEGKTTEEMKKQATYSGWDFDTVWKIDDGNDYPTLR